MVANQIQFWQSYITETDALLLKTELQNYHANVYPHHAAEPDPVKYWKGQKPNMLSHFALKILSLAPSSASVERLFSKLARTKTKYRARLNLDILESLGKIKLDALHERVDKDSRAHMSMNHLMKTIYKRLKRTNK